MKRSVHPLSTFMAHPHNLPSFPAREEGDFFKNPLYYYGRPIPNECQLGNQPSQKEDDVVSHDTGILDHNHCPHITVNSGRKQCLKI
jgi:hypothetical protein